MPVLCYYFYLSKRGLKNIKINRQFKLLLLLRVDFYGYVACAQWRGVAFCEFVCDFRIRVCLFAHVRLVCN